MMYHYEKSGITLTSPNDEKKFLKGELVSKFLHEMKELETSPDTESFVREYQILWNKYWDLAEF